MLLNEYLLLITQRNALILHIFYHFLAPAIITLVFFRKNWKLAYTIMMLTMLVDLDHLLADPIYDPSRCSIGFHPLHGFIPIIFYFVLSVVPRPRILRYIGIGLLIHMALDSIDCQLTNGIWYSQQTINTL